MLVAVALTLVAPCSRAEAAQAPRAKSCIPVVAIACGLAGDAISAVGDVAGDVIGAGAKAVGNTVLDGVASWVGQGAAWLIGRIGRQVERSTRPELGAAWFTRQYSGMVSLALLLSLAFLLAALAHAAIRQDLAAALRAAFVALPLAVIACFVAVTLVELLLSATDGATAMLTQHTGGATRDFFRGLSSAIVPTGTPPLPGFLALLGGLIAALLSVVVWLELILREAAVYLAVGFLPLSLSAMVWHRTGHLARRLVEGLASVILAKLAIAVAVAFAASALAHGSSGGGITTLLGGCAVLFLAALSPWLLLRLIPIGGDAQIHRGSVKQAVGSAPGAGTAAMVVRTGMYSAFASSAAPAAAASMATAPPSQPWTPSPPTGAGMRLGTRLPDPSEPARRP